jgi:hypothetical protein
LTFISMSLKAAFNGVINNIRFGLGCSPANIAGYDHDLMVTLLSTVIINGVNLPPYFFKISEMISNDGINSIESQKFIIAITSYGGCIIIAIFLWFYAIFATYIYFRDMKNASSVMRSVSEKTAQESLTTILKKCEDERVDIGGSINWHMTDNFKIIIPLTLYLFVSICTFLIFVAAFITPELNSFQQVFTYYKESTKRHTSILHFINTLIAFAINQITKEQVLNETTNDINTLMKSHSQLMIDSLSYDPDIDDLHMRSNCTSEAESNSMFSIQCSSLDNKIQIISRFMEKIVKKIKSGTVYDLDDVEFSKILYILDSGLNKQLLSFNEIMLSKIDYITNGIASKSRLYSLLGILIAIVFFIIILILIKNLSISFDGMKQLISLLPPKDVLRNKIIVDFFVKEDNNRNDHVLTFTEMIINASANIVISTSSSLIIDAINPTLKKITGFQSDTVIHQPLSRLIPVDSDHNMTATTASTKSKSHSASFGEGSEILYKRIEEMRSDPNKKSITVNVNMISESNENIPVTATVVAIRENDEISSFLITLYDRRAEISEREKAKEAKKRSTKLLRGLLPQQAYSALRKREQNLLFVSDQAIAIFVNINRFPEIVGVLQPSEVIKLLRCIYEKFDDIRRKYPAVERLKTNDELMLCCSGLFNYKDDPGQQSTQSVMYCLELLEEIKQINFTYNTEFSLSIGLNMGGPMCGSVMDVKTPSFDIIGTLIGNAMKLVTEGEEDVVQINEQIANYLPRDKFEVTEGTVLVSWYTKKKTQCYNVRSKQDNQKM